MAKHLEKGKEAEQMAEKYLEIKGYKIVERNFRAGKGEIDLIGYKEGWIVFFEVRYRKNSDYGYPEQTISNKKEKLLWDTALEYVHSKNWNGNIRYDIISITEEDGIVHLEDAIVN
jgi:putative endonuclease